MNVYILAIFLRHFFLAFLRPPLLKGRQKKATVETIKQLGAILQKLCCYFGRREGGTKRYRWRESYSHVLNVTIIASCYRINLIICLLRELENLCCRMGPRRM